MEFTNNESKCGNCNLTVLPGETHYVCTQNPEVSAQLQCIYCLADERYGDHSECQDRIAKFRYELINFFKS
jgi:hypothetical protein